MADKNAEVAVEDNGGMKKTLSLWNFFTIGFGAIIGTGWVLHRIPLGCNLPRARRSCFR